MTFPSPVGSASTGIRTPLDVTVQMIGAPHVLHVSVTIVFKFLPCDAGGMNPTFVQWVFALLLSLPPAYGDAKHETELERDSRMFRIAQAVAEVSNRATCSEAYELPKCDRQWLGKRRDLAAALVSKGWWESRFAWNVHAGKCKWYECDGGRARSPWQLQQTTFSSPEWGTMVGTDFESTRDAAWAATKVLSYGRRRCGNARGALSWYAAQRCDWSKVGDRVKTLEKLLAKH